MRILIKNVRLLTLDDHFTEFNNGFVLFDEEKILALGENNSELPKAERVIDGQRGILLPGFVNAHTHCGMIPFRSLGDDTPDRLRRFLFPLEQDFMTAKLVAASSQYAMAEMLLSGVTGFCDMYYFENEVATVADEMKMRAVLGETIIDMVTCDAATPQTALDYNEKFIKKWQAHPLITPAIAPHASNTNNVETLNAIVALSKKYQAPITMHVAEMDYEMTYFNEEYQKTPVEFLNELNFLQQSFILAHGIHLTPTDIQQLASSKTVSVAHCIAANTKSAKGVAPVKELIEAGVTIALGTDGPSSGNTLDLFTQMRMVANFHKTKNHDRSLFPAKEIVKMATRNGAESLGFKNCGQIKVGYQADLTLVETNSINMFPIFDAYSALVYSANASNVSAVWVNGHQLVANKQLIEQDPVAIKRRLSLAMHDFVVAAREKELD